MPCRVTRVNGREDEQAKLSEICSVQDLLHQVLEVSIDRHPASLRLSDLLADLRCGGHDCTNICVLVCRTIFPRATQRHPHACEAEVAEQALIATEVVGEVDGLCLDGVVLLLGDRLVGLGELDELFSSGLDVLIAIAVTLATRVHADGLKHGGIINPKRGKLHRELRTEERVHEPRGRENFVCGTILTDYLHRASTVQTEHRKSGEGG